MVSFWCEDEYVAGGSLALQSFFHKFHTSVRYDECSGRDYVKCFETGMGADVTDCFLFLSEWFMVPGTMFPITCIRPLPRSKMFNLQMCR